VVRSIASLDEEEGGEPLASVDNVRVLTPGEGVGYRV
jgi:hypothetical protein